MNQQPTPPTPDSARLFLALCPDAHVKAALAAHARGWHWPVGAALYDPHDWHVTLHFIGSVPRQRLAELGAGLDVPAGPFELRFGQPARWSKGLALLLPVTVPEALQQLHERLGQALTRLGLPADARPYQPHITLARCAAQAVPPQTAPAFVWRVQGYALMESTGESGQRYRLLHSYGVVE